MVNKIQNQLKMDLFLKQLQLLSQKNELTPKQVYAQLIFQGIPEEEKKQDLSNSFEKLIDKNKNNAKTRVFVDPGWSYFCQFMSRDAGNTRNNNPIKIYVPLKKENIESSVQKIFDFIEKNDIVHCSKLAKHTRIDDLVIRVYEKEDAEKIIKFINEDKDLTNNMYDANPFVINEGKIGITMDRMLSFNDILSKYICEYINEVNKNKMFASKDGFNMFLQTKLKRLQEKEDLSTFIKMADSRELKMLPVFLQSVEEITTILIKVTSGNTKESLYEYFYQVNNKDYNVEKYQEYSDFDYKKMLNNGYSLLRELVLVTNQKYGYNNTRSNLEAFKETGDLTYITRTNDLREKIARSKTFKTYIRTFDLEEQLNTILPKINEEIVPSKETILEDVLKSTYLACQTPERGYCGKTQVARALIAMQTNDYDCITRTNNARNKAKENIRPDEIKKIIKNTLETNGYILETEQELYWLYANHIEYLCNNNEVKRGK